MCAFEPEMYHQALRTGKYGRLLLSTHSIPSTQLIMLQNRKAMPHGVPPKPYSNKIQPMNSRVCMSISGALEKQLSALFRNYISQYILKLSLQVQCA